jgi:hypothetical protein
VFERLADWMAQLESMGYVSCPSSFTSAPVKDKSASVRYIGKKNERILATIGVMRHRINPNPTINRGEK